MFGFTLGPFLLNCMKRCLIFCSCPTFFNGWFIAILFRDIGCFLFLCKTTGRELITDDGKDMLLGVCGPWEF